MTTVSQNEQSEQNQPEQAQQAPSAAVGLRERNRRELTAEILASGRRHLAEHGSANLSLRAITRDLGMASSAIYRYFSSRDELLTALIIEAYNDLADRVEEADGRITERSDHQARWLAISSGIRGWGLDNPQQWALIYGTPIKGYAAPQDTVAAATRATGPLLRLLIDGAQGSDTPESPVRGDRSVLASGLSDILAQLGDPVPEERVVTGLGAWAEVVGLVSLELFGHLENVVSDSDAHYAYLVKEISNRLAFDSGN